MRVRYEGSRYPPIKVYVIARIFNEAHFKKLIWKMQETENEIKIGKKKSM